MHPYFSFMFTGHKAFVFSFLCSLYFMVANEVIIFIRVRSHQRVLYPVTELNQSNLYSVVWWKQNRKKKHFANPRYEPMNQTRKWFRLYFDSGSKLSAKPDDIESKYNLNRSLVLFIGSYLEFAKCYFMELSSYNSRNCQLVKVFLLLDGPSLLQILLR